MDDTSGRTLTDRLTATERERRWPVLRPKDAATLILLDRRGRSPKVLMGRRHEGHTFMPGKFVFPGGRIEPADRAMPAAGALSSRADAALAARVARPSPIRRRMLGLAAIRETFEETGLAIGTGEYGPPPSPVPAPWSAFAALGLYPNLEALHFVARAITPPRRPKRFDTRFFAADRGAVTAEAPGIVGPESELVELVWVKLSDARRLDLPAITGVILDELEQRLAAGFRPELPVPYYYERNGRFRRETL